MSRMIDKKFKISKHFKLGEFTKLRRVGGHADIDHKILRNILLVSDVMDKIRDHFNRPIVITSGVRPEFYNKMIGGAKKSRHLNGRACDFIIMDKKGTLNCDSVRSILEPLMHVYGFSMENLYGSSWIHIDLDKRQSEYKFFRP